MRLSEPTGLALAVLGLVVILCHLWQDRAARLVVPSLYLWRRALLQAARGWRLRIPLRRLLLALQLGVLTAMTFALAEPVWHGRRTYLPPVLLVLDASASMRAPAGGRTRFAQAQVRAAALLAQLERTQRAALILAGLKPRLVVPATRDRKALAKAIAAARPTDAPLDLDALLALIARLDREPAQAGGEVVFFSDGDFPRAQELPYLIASAARTWRQELIGTAVANLGFTAVSLEERGKRNGGVLRAALGNFGPAREVEIRFWQDGRVLATQTRSLAAGERAALSLALPDATRGRLILSLQGRDGLAADDRAFAYRPPAAGLRLLVVGKGDYYLLRALATLPGVRLAQADLLPQRAYDDYDLVVAVDVSLPASPRGNLWSLGALPRPSAMRAAGTTGRNRIALTDAGHPLLRFADPHGIRIWKAVRCEPLQAAQVVVAGETSPLIWLEEAGVVWAFAPSDSDWPLRISFPVICANTVAYIAGDKLDPTRFLSGARETGVGFQRLAGRLTACSLASAEESDLTPRRLLPPWRSGRSTARAAELRRFTLAPYLLLLGMALLAAEAFLMARADLLLGRRKSS